MNIFLKENAISHCIFSPRLLPQLFEEIAQIQIDKPLTSGVLVKCDEPTDWCVPGFFVPKGNGKHISLVTGYTKFNKFVVRPLHPFPSVTEIVQTLPASSKCFAFRT